MNRRLSMDAVQFDRISKTLASGTPRRRILQSLAGAVLISGLGIGTTRTTAAAPPDPDCPAGTQAFLQQSCGTFARGCRLATYSCDADGFRFTCTKGNNSSCF
jgi:hypothetical protein